MVGVREEEENSGEKKPGGVEEVGFFPPPVQPFFFFARIIFLLLILNLFDLLSIFKSANVSFYNKFFIRRRQWTSCQKLKFLNTLFFFLPENAISYIIMINSVFYIFMQTLFALVNTLGIISIKEFTRIPPHHYYF